MRTHPGAALWRLLRLKSEPSAKPSSHELAARRARAAEQAEEPILLLRELVHCYDNGFGYRHVVNQARAMLKRMGRL